MIILKIINDIIKKTFNEKKNKKNKKIRLSDFIFDIL